MRNSRWATLRLCVVLFGAAVGAAMGEPRNLSSLKQEILEYVDSGAYEREMAAATVPLSRYLSERVAGKVPGERLTLVLDIDETVLSSLPTMRENDFGYVPAVWSAWLARGEAPAIEPMRAVFRAARKAEVEVVFITGRRERDRPGTEKNLRAVGLGDYAALYCTPDDFRGTTEAFKTSQRRQLVTEGRTIIANVGDQASDLAGGFAERTFKLPAPFYLTK